MATGGKDRGSREARERARIYQARLAFHDGQKRRRTRDNLIAAIAGGVIVVVAVAAQVAYFSVGPGTPEPVASVEPSPTTSVEPTPAPTDGATPAPEPGVSTPSATPAP